MKLYKTDTSEERVLLKSGDLHIEVDKIGILHTLNPLRVVYLIVKAIQSNEEFLVKPENIVEIE